MEKASRILEVVLFDKWNDRASIVGLICVTAALFASEGSVLDWATFSVGVAMLLAIVVRSGYLIACMRRGEPVAREPRSAARIRSLAGSAFFALYFICAAVLLAIRYGMI